MRWLACGFAVQAHFTLRKALSGRENTQTVSVVHTLAAALVAPQRGSINSLTVICLVIGPTMLLPCSNFRGLYRMLVGGAGRTLCQV